MMDRFIRNFLNGQHIICKFRHVQAVRLTVLHQYIKNVCPAAVLSCGARMASSSSSSNRPSQRSKLLDDFHKNRTANLQLTNLGKNVVELAQDPQGSRFIQQKLGRANPTEKTQFVDALRGHVLTLSQQMYGSHVIRTALKSVDNASQIEIINEISAQVIPLSLQKYGCWVIQCVLEHCTHKRLVLEQLHANVPTLATDQYGCFVIEHVIEHGLAEDRGRIVHILQGDIMKYAQDKFGYLVIRKCLICGTADQKKALFDNVCVGGPKTLQNARQLMADEFGSHLIEKFFECGTDDQKAQLVDALRGHVLTLALQIYGCPVIQTALKSVDKASQMKIINEILAQVIPLSLHKYGSRVIECVLEHCTHKRPVLEQLLGNVPTLVADQYGNYVIKHVIEHGLPEDRARIVRSLQGDIMKYAQDKFASNVILKCLTCGTTDQKKALFDNICVGGPKTLQNARQLMADEFGSHVIEKFFEYGTDDHKAQLVDALRGHVLELALQIYGGPVIQTALKSVDNTSQMKILEELTPRSCVIKCIKDHYGSYVMNMIFELIEPQRLQFVVDAILYSPSDSVASLSVHQYASRVIECVLEHCTEQQKRPVLEQLHDNVSKLLNKNRTDNLQLADWGKHVVEFAQDPRGSKFIVQKLEHANPTEMAQLVDALRGHAVTLALHKSGNHVIRTALKSVDRASQIEIINEISAQVLILSLHEYGSRVIKRVLEHCTEQQRHHVLEQLHGNVLSLVTDQYGSCVIEHVLEHGLPEDRARIVRILHENVLNLVTDQYGCFVIEHVIEHGLPEDRGRIVRYVHEKVLTLVTDQYGCFVIEHVLEHGQLEDRARIVHSLHGNVLNLVTDKYGSYVIKLVLEHCTEQQKRHVLEQLHGNVLSLVTDQYGSCVIQHVLEHGLPEDRARIVRILHENVLNLVTDKYGSYVIRHVIEHGLPEDREPIVRNLQGKIMKNTHLHSFCSIIEKCLVFGTTEQKNALIDQVCMDNGSGKPPLLEMIKRPFGKDVVQKMLNVADSARHQKMMFVINTAPNTSNRSSKSLKQRAAQSPPKKGRSRKTDNGRVSP